MVQTIRYFSKVGGGFGKFPMIVFIAPAAHEAIGSLFAPLHARLVEGVDPEEEGGRHRHHFQEVD